MSEAYAREILRRNVAQICQTIGWNGINSTPVDILVHVLEKYIKTLGTQANRYAEQFNRTEPNLHDLGLVFRDLHINLPDLAEYTRSVPPVPPPVNTEKFPKPKESNLNFLKPGSHEVVTRPVHVHEHLPPMYPEKERDTPAVADTVEIQQNGFDTSGISGMTCNSPELSVTDSPEKCKEIFKRPTDPISLPNSKRPRLRLDEEERTREISSVMMTMSGFLSPAREGKLPEAKVPTIISEKHEKHKANSHHSSLAKVPMHSPLDKIEKKSKKNKLLNGKVMKSKKRDKSHKNEGSKSKDKSDKSKSKDGHAHLNHTAMSMAVPVPKPLQISASMGNAVDQLASIIKQEPIDPIPSVSRTILPGEDAIPVPRKIPISISPLVSNSSVPMNKSQTSTSLVPDNIVIKKEKIDEDEKLASQPDRSKINIFKRISNKSKEEKSNHDILDKSQASISRYNIPPHQAPSESRLFETKSKTQDSFVNNNDDSAVDLTKHMDLTTNEVINIDDDYVDPFPLPYSKPNRYDSLPNPLTINKSLFPSPKGAPGVGPKQKKERKHKEKKDKAAEKAAKLEAKLLKKQQQQLALEMARAEKIKMGNSKPPKLHRPKNDLSKLPQLPPGFPFFPNMPPGGLIPGPGLIPNAGLIPGGDYLAELANNPALRGLHNPSLLNNPFMLGASSSGLIPGPSFLSGLSSNFIPPISNIGQSSRSNKIPSMLCHPGLEVIPVNNDDDRGLHKPHRDKDRHEKHKSPTIPNILQKNKTKAHKDSHHKSNLLKMPPIHPDITIKLNPPKPEPEKPPKPDPPVQPPPPRQSPTPEPVPIPQPIPVEPDPVPDVQVKEDNEKSEKKKDKSHKKEKRDKDGIKIKKKKDKKEKNKDKSEKKKDKEEVKIKKEKKDKKKDKATDGLVPKLTLKLGSSSPMPPSSPDIFKLNIKPVVKKEEEEPASKDEENVTRDHSRSPELAQISALVTRPPKQKSLKLNHSETETQPLSPPTSSSPTRKNRPPSSSNTKYKRILFKTLAKKGQVENFNEDVESENEEAEQPSPSVGKPSGPLPTPYYVDEQGNKVWVCPACGQPDNGSPMIGCDGCDGWYHWVCVGITEEPGATEDWFCKSCVAKRAAMVLAGVTAAGRKRGRKPKAEKIRDCH